MKPAPFDYLRPDDEEEALEALAEAGDDARLLAGGQTLMPMLNMRLVEPAVLIDISRLAGRAKIEDDGSVIEVGAAVTQAQLEAWPALAERAPLLAQALPLLGHMSRPGAGARCAAPSPSPTRARSCRSAWLCWEAKSCCARARERGRCPPPRSRPGCCPPRAARTRWWRRCAFPPPSRARAMPSPSSRAGTGTSPSSPSPPSHGRTASGSAWAVSPSSRRWEEWPALAGSALDDALNALAWSLDAADDVHASARYRRELVRRILGKQAVQAALEARS